MSNQEHNGRPEMPSVLDREVSDRAHDAFGHQHFADALRSLIESRSHLPPFSIGLLGPWGTGKSTIKELYLADLESDSTGKRGQRRKDRIHTITFNAWRYGGEDIKRALLRHAFMALGGDEVTLRRELYHQVSESSQTRRSFWEWTKEAVAQNAASVIVFIVLLVAVMAAAWGFAALVGLEAQLGLSVLGPVALVTAGFLAKYVVDIRLRSPALFTPTTTISFPSTSAEEYEHLLLRQLGEFKKTSKGRNCERLVVFVDDLDRLSAAEMVAGLDAVRTFLELPTNAVPDGLGVIFAISCDEDRVAEALAKGRGRLGSSELPGSVFTRSDARRYLDRLFQFRLEIPRFPKVDMRLYAERKLRGMGSVVAELEARDVRVEDLLERLIHVGVQSPRNALQLLNAFAQSWWIATQRERDAVGSDGPGGLYAGAVTSHPIALSALCVLRVDFPDFYNHLQRRPDLINEFNSVVFGTADAVELAVGAQEALREFVVAGDGGAITKEIRREHRDLRRYLSSLQSLRWPERLQPLLLLAQDAISRQYGDRAAALYDAFVSGDTKGVLEVFGRHLDDKPLTENDVRLLADLSEGVGHDTEIRRINAARVLAALVERVPAEHARGLMSPLARQLVAIKAVRMNVGPKAASKIIQHTVSVDQQEVASRLVADLLTGNEGEWRLPTGETPNLNELIEVVREAVKLTLDVRRQHGLSETTDIALKSWLLTREIRSGEKSQTLPFSELDQWVEEHEGHLMPALGADYCDVAIAEFEAQDGVVTDEASTVRRVEEQLRGLSEEGEESRGRLWELLTRLIAVRSSSAFDAARNAVVSFADLASNVQACAVISAMAIRLKKEMDEQEGWALDWESGTKTLLELMGRWSDVLDAETAEKIGNLIRAWSDVEETAEFAARGFALLEAIDGDASAAVMDHLISKPFGTLEWPCRELIASRTHGLSAAQKTALVAQMDAVINADDPDDNACVDYVRFVEGAPEAVWAGKPLAQHLEQLLTRLQAMFKDQNQFLTKLFPAGRALLAAAPDGRGAAFLKQLFEQAAGAPEAYVLVHREMVGAWPAESEPFGTYGATQVAERAAQFMEQNPALVGVGSVLDSVADLVSRGIAAASVAPQVAKVPAALWPHCPETIARNAESLGALMSPTDIGALLTGSHPEESVAEQLESIVAAVRATQDREKMLATTRKILATNPVQVNELPDGALSVWMDALGEELPNVLQSLLGDADLNDAQRERLYRGAFVRKEALGMEFFLWALPTAIGDDGLPRLRSAAIESRADIAAMATSDESKSNLVDRIIPVLNKLGGDDLSAMLRLIRELGGKGALERSSDLVDSMDDVSLEIVVREIPDSRVFKRAAKARQSEGS